MKVAASASHVEVAFSLSKWPLAQVLAGTGVVAPLASVEVRRGPSNDAARRLHGLVVVLAIAVGGGECRVQVQADRVGLRQAQEAALLVAPGRSGSPSFTAAAALPQPLSFGVPRPDARSVHSTSWTHPRPGRGPHSRDHPTARGPPLVHSGDDARSSR